MEDLHRPPITYITFSPFHSRLRMRIRGISENDVRKVIMFPDHQFYGRYGLWQAFKRLPGKNIIVIYEFKGNGHAHVVTVKRKDFNNWSRRKINGKRK